MHTTSEYAKHRCIVPNSFSVYTFAMLRREEKGLRKIIREEGLGKIDGRKPYIMIRDGSVTMRLEFERENGRTDFVSVVL